MTTKQNQAALNIEETLARMVEAGEVASMGSPSLFRLVEASVTYRPPYPRALHLQLTTGADHTTALRAAWAAVVAARGVLEGVPPHGSA